LVFTALFCFTPFFVFSSRMSAPYYTLQVFFSRRISPERNSEQTALGRV
jgi:hypothetical protein